MPVRLVHAFESYPRAFDIARSLGWKKAYDALYLAAAEHEGAELLTADRGMGDAARRLGIRATLPQ
jgi:predicted nucleic acid-binding protein